MTSEVSSKIAKFAHDYRSRLLQEQGKTAAKMTKYDVALFMKKEGALTESEFNSWVKEKEGQEALQLTNQQKDAIKRGTIFSFAQGTQSYLDSDEVSNFTLGNVLGFEKTTNEKTGSTTIKSKEVSRKKFNVAEEMKKQSFYNYIKSLPTPQATYTELMRSIEFDKLDNQGKMEMMLKISGEKYNEAKEKGDKQAMKDYLLEGIGMALQLSCQKIDSAVGITQFKEWAKERSGLNFLVDLVDKYVDDGDEATLSWMEKNWEGVKGFGDALDSFIGTQAVAFIGALELAGAAAGTGAIGQVFNAATKAYFLYDGGKMMVDGATRYYNAETKQEARQAGTEFGMGTVIFTGTLKSVIGEIQAYRAKHAGTPNPQGGLPELSEGHKALVETNASTPEARAQVSTDLAFLQENGIEIVNFQPGHGVNHTESSFIIKYNGKTYDVTNDIIGPSEFNVAVSQLAQHIKGEAPKVWTETDAIVKPQPQQIIANAEAKIATTEVSYARGGMKEFSTAKDAQGNVVKTTVKEGAVENNTYIDGGKTVSQTTVEGKVIGSYVHDGKTGTYIDAKGNVITEQAFGEAVAEAARKAHISVTPQYSEMTSEQLRSVAQTPDGVKALADAKVVVTKGNAADFGAKDGNATSPNAKTYQKPDQNELSADYRRIQKNIIDAMDIGNVKYDKNVVADMLEKYPDFVQKLYSYETADGSRLFASLDIADFLYNARGTIIKAPERIFEELDKPGAIEDIASWENRSYALFKRVPNYKATTPPKGPDGNKKYVKPQMTETSVKPENDVMTSTAEKSTWQSVKDGFNKTFRPSKYREQVVAENKAELSETHGNILQALADKTVFRKIDGVYGHEPYHTQEMVNFANDLKALEAKGVTIKDIGTDGYNYYYVEVDVLGATKTIKLGFQGDVKMPIEKALSEVKSSSDAMIRAQKDHMAAQKDLDALQEKGIRVLQNYTRSTGLTRDHVPEQNAWLTDNIVVFEYKGRAYRCHCKQWNEGHSESEIVAMLREQVEGKAKYFDEVEPQESGVAESEMWGNLGIVYEKENISFDDIFKQPEYPYGAREYKGPGKLKSILN